MRLETILRKKAKRPLHRRITGKIIRNATKIATVFARNNLLNCRIKTMKPLKEVRKSMSKETRVDVELLLRKEDNFRVQPGKADAREDQEGTKHQTVVLDDYR